MANQTLYNQVIQHLWRPDASVSKITRLVHVPNGGRTTKDLDTREVEDVIVVAMPSAPWFKVPGREAYGSRDTLKELIVAKPPTSIDERIDIIEALVMFNSRTVGRLDNDPESEACMSMTKSVPIYVLDTKSGNAVPFEDGKTFYILAAAGEDAGELFLVDELWYSEVEWDPAMPQVKEAMQRSYRAMNRSHKGKPAASSAAAVAPVAGYMANVGEPEGGIQVYQVSPDLITRTPIGFAVGFPQWCRLHLPWGVSNTYTSVEWFKEITVTTDHNNIQAARQSLPRNRVDNESGAVACAHVSMRVPVWLRNPDGAGGWTNTPVIPNNPEGFFTLVASGNYEDPINETGLFLASEIWIGDQPWPTTAKIYQDAMARAANAGSPCL